MRPFSQYLGCSLSFLMSCGGDEEDRTPDPLLAKQVLSQLSYTPAVLPALSKLNNTSITSSC